MSENVVSQCNDNHPNSHTQLVRPMRPGAAIEVSEAKLLQRGKGGVTGGRGDDNLGEDCDLVTRLVG